jgi:hypothetical protein
MESPEQKLLRLYKELFDHCISQGWGNPYNYNRIGEIYLSIILGHTIAPTYSGADAIDECGECEYKTTIDKNIKGTYNGISVQSTWQEQVIYLTEKKIANFDNHYFARSENGQFLEVWRIPGVDVLNILLPKLEKDWNRKINGNQKDPRLSGTICKGEIHRYGTKVYG